MSTVNHKKYVKSYLKGHKDGSRQPEPLNSRHPVRTQHADEGSSSNSSEIRPSGSENHNDVENFDALGEDIHEQISAPMVSGNPHEVQNADSFDSNIDNSPTSSFINHHEVASECSGLKMMPASSSSLNSVEKDAKAAILTRSTAGVAVKLKTSKSLPAKSHPKQAKPLYARAQIMSKKNIVGGSKKNPNLLSLPDEIQLKILSCLSPADLLATASVCKHWNHLANDDVLWKNLHDKLVTKNDKQKAKQPSASKYESDSHYWKWQCIKSLTANRNKIVKLLDKIDPYTGLPQHTEKCLSHLGVRWRLAFVDKDSQETFIDHRDMFYQRISVTVRWYSLEMPSVGRLKKLRLYAGCPVFFENNKPLKNSPCQMSLLYEFDLDWQSVSKVEPVAMDDRIELRIVSPLMIATWKDGGEIAFISACLHKHRLVDACLEASRQRAMLHSLRRPQNGWYSGLFGYNVTMELRNQRQSYWSDQFRSIYFNKEEIAVGKAVLKLLSPEQSYKHTPIQQRLHLPWKTDLFKNILQNVCVLDLVLLNESQIPIWCVSTPVHVAKPISTAVVYDYDGDFYAIDYEDSFGHVHMELIWEEDIGHFMITCLHIHVNLVALGVENCI